MTWYYGKCPTDSTQYGFYTSNVDCLDGVEVSDNDYATLMEGCTCSKRIIPNPDNNNYPMLSDTGYSENAVDCVRNSGNETIAGTKTFTSSPIVPTPSSSDNSTKPATTAWVNEKLPSKPTITQITTLAQFQNAIANIDIGDTFIGAGMSDSNSNVNRISIFNAVYVGYTQANMMAGSMAQGFNKGTAVSVAQIYALDPTGRITVRYLSDSTTTSTYYFTPTTFNQVYLIKYSS